MANITVKTLKKGDHEIVRVKEMMRELFPVDEQSSVEELLEIACSPNSEFTIYRVKNELCGFSFVTSQYGLVFVYYLAVSQKYQSMGYGTKIFDIIKTQHKEATVVLNIEPLDESAQNYRQRVRRLNFYRKNGLNLTQYILCHEGIEYQILASDSSLDTKKYKQLLEGISKEYVQSKIYVK